MLKIQLFAGNLLLCKGEEILITLDPLLAFTFQRISFDHGGKYQVFMQVDSLIFKHHPSPCIAQARVVSHTPSPTPFVVNISPRYSFQCEESLGAIVEERILSTCTFLRPPCQADSSPDFPALARGEFLLWPCGTFLFETPLCLPCPWLLNPESYQQYSSTPLGSGAGGSEDLERN